MARLTPLNFYLSVLKPKTVFSGRVNGTPTDPYMSITWDGGATGTTASAGSFGVPNGPNTVWFGTAAGGRERGVIRMRSWTPTAANNPVSGTLSIAESDDVGPQIADDDYITIKQDYRLWSIAPRLVQAGETVTYFEDYDIAYTDATDDWWPTVVAGPPAVALLSGGSATASFVGDRSTLHADGAAWSSHSWESPGSVEGAIASQGTTGSPVVFTYSSAGQYVVKYTATDDNGNSNDSYTNVFVVDPTDPTSGDAAYENFTAGGDQFDFNSGGGEGTFTVFGVADVSEFPRDSLVVLACDQALDTPHTGTWPFRDNVLFVGYIVGNSVRQDPTQGTTTFRAASIHALMGNLKQFPLTMRDANAPTRWVEGKDITVDRAASFIFNWRSTLGKIAPVSFSGYAPQIPWQDLGPSALWQQLQSELLKDAWARMAVNHQGVVHLEIDYNHMLVAERAAVQTGKTLNKASWVDTVDITERHEYDRPSAVIKTGGIQYTGGGDPTKNVTPLFSEAPGDEVPSQFGSEGGGSSYILNDQTDLNIRTGFMLAKENQRFPSVRMSFLNDGAFTVAPQTIFPSQIEATDNNRGVLFAGVDLICRRVRRSYDQVNGIINLNVDFEPSTTGPAGVTIVRPATPPSPGDPGVVIPPPEPPWEQALGLMSVNPNGTVYYFGLGSSGLETDDPEGFQWQPRRGGQTGARLKDQHGGVDPFWWTRFKKNTYDPDEAIFFKSGLGYIDRSVNAGILSWDDVTPSTPATVTGSTFVGFESDLFVNSRHLAMGRWVASGTTHYESGLWFTPDDGTTWLHAAM